MNLAEVLIVGGGAAGMLAAAAAVTAGARVVLLEKNDRLGCKLRLTGGGRGNLTNTASLPDFVANVPGNGKFLFSALTNFSGAACRAFLERIGVPTKVETQGRVFPVSDDASQVVRALEDYLTDAGVRIIFATRVTGLVIEENFCRGVTAEPGGFFPGKAVVVATGGVSYPQTGSTGDGYHLAAQAGHRLTPLYPSLVPLLLAEETVCRQLQGLALPEVKLALDVTPHAKPAQTTGEIIFTHFGLSGPAALRLSRTAALCFSKEPAANLNLSLDLFPGKSEETLTEQLLNLATAQPQKSPQSIARQLLPNRLAELSCRELRIAPRQKSGATGKKTWRALAGWGKNLRFTVTGTKPLAEAMVTAGGISLAQIDPGNLASRLVSGLYFAGETLDLDAYTGGFNLQTAFATGWAAGQAAATHPIPV